MCRRNVRILSLCCEWLNVAARGYGTSAAAAAADDDAAIILQSPVLALLHLSASSFTFVLMPVLKKFQPTNNISL